MRGLLVDVNAVGEFRVLPTALESAYWKEVWTSLNLPVKTHGDLGLPPRTSDLVIWQTCQAQQLVLVTDNRNQDEPDSLESAIQNLNTDQSLPVLTLANAQRIFHSKPYVERIGERLLDILLNLDNYRGTGRLYLP